MKNALEKLVRENENMDGGVSLKHIIPLSLSFLLLSLSSVQRQHCSYQRPGAAELCNLPGVRTRRVAYIGKHLLQF
jgi:hypothetical protein